MKNQNEKITNVILSLVQARMLVQNLPITWQNQQNALNISEAIGYLRRLVEANDGHPFKMEDYCWS